MFAQLCMHTSCYCMDDAFYADGLFGPVLTYAIARVLHMAQVEHAPLNNRCSDTLPYMIISANFTAYRAALHVSETLQRLIPNGMMLYLSL